MFRVLNIRHIQVNRPFKIAFQDFPSNSKAQNRAGPKIFLGSGVISAGSQPFFIQGTLHKMDNALLKILLLAVAS